RGPDRLIYAAVAAQTPTEIRQFGAGKPTRRTLEAAGAMYYQMRQGHISGDALAVHSTPREPCRFTGIEAMVKRQGQLDQAIARYAFPGAHRGGRLVAGEYKLLTGGGFYDRIGDYAGLMRTIVAADARRYVARDFSISYDYGVVINAFARCVAAAAVGQ